jgi:hypothetical protein
MSTYLVSTAEGVRTWTADDAEHAREQHTDAFPDEPITFAEHVPATVVPGLAGEQVATIVEGFQYELCEQCSADIDGHLIGPDPLGNAHAYCLTDWWVVVDTEGVKPGQQCPVVGLFTTHNEASEYIGTLPDAESGRYGLDSPASDEVTS